MKKLNLRSGEAVKNVISKNIGKICVNEDGQVVRLIRLRLFMSPYYVRVKTRIKIGKNIGKIVYRVWNIENLKPVD